MPITVGIDAYADITYAATYLAAQQPNLLASSAWATRATAEKEGALVDASLYLDSGFDYIGNLRNPATQTLGWPRWGAVDDEGRYIDEHHPLCDALGIPTRIKQASVILAAMSFDNPIISALDRGGAEKRVKVGPIEQEFFDTAAAETAFPFLRRMLKGLYVGSTGGGYRLFRNF